MEIFKNYNGIDITPTKNRLTLPISRFVCSHGRSIHLFEVHEIEHESLKSGRRRFYPPLISSNISVRRSNRTEQINRLAKIN